MGLELWILSLSQSEIEAVTMAVAESGADTYVVEQTEAPSLSLMGGLPTMSLYQAEIEIQWESPFPSLQYYTLFALPASHPVLPSLSTLSSQGVCPCHNNPSLCLDSESLIIFQNRFGFDGACFILNAEV